MPYMVTFTINIHQMLAYIAYMDPMGMGYHGILYIFLLGFLHVSDSKPDFGSFLSQNGSSVIDCWEKPLASRTKSENPLLVGGWATPLKNMSSSIGMIRNPIYGKIKNVPNHQPV